MASESFSVTAKPQQHLRSLLLKHRPGYSSDLLQNTRHLAHFDSWFMEPALLPSESGELSWNELFPCGQPGNFPGRSTPSETACRDGGGGICSLWLRRFFLSLMLAEPVPLEHFVWGYLIPYSAPPSPPPHFSFPQDLPQIQNNFVTGLALDPELCMWHHTPTFPDYLLFQQNILLSHSLCGKGL